MNNRITLKCVALLMKTEDRNLKVSKEGYMGGLRGQKGKG